MQPKVAEQQEARQLREAGLSYKRIASRLGVSVGSVHGWTRDIELTAEQHEAIRSAAGGPQSPETIALRATACSATARRRRAISQEEGRSRARNGDDSLHFAGCILHWAEGSKDRNASSSRTPIQRCSSSSDAS